ncbi:MAG TPA: N-acetylglucosamine-6-phosphate deacetylase [Blastocatellia bacterium]|nr:N-acetylglucosamine-6-phosphate deacetylase [Blastocatellia bacterium]
MSLLLLHNARVVREDGIIHGGVWIAEGRIAQVFSHEQTPAGISSRESIDLSGAFLAPGLIDIHIHGSAGIDVQNTDASGLAKLSEFLLNEGVTAYFATFVPTDDNGYREAIANVDSYIASQEQTTRGAQIVGIHFEGPFVSHNRCGALQPEYFRTYDGDPRSIETFINRTEQRRLMTLAPEVAGGIELTRELTRRGLRAFVGHSQAQPATLDLAFEAGARHITHFPNALDPLHHRKPGAVAWGLLRQDVSIDCIADFHHVDPTMLRLIFRAKGANRIALISDAIQPAGLGDGDFTVWGAKIAVRDGHTALVEGPSADAIAGSVISMLQAMKNMVSLGIPLHEAIKMGSLIPARAAGLDRERGSIEIGKHADLISFDEDLNIALAVTGGKVRFRL